MDFNVPVVLLCVALVVTALLSVLFSAIRRKRGAIKSRSSTENGKQLSIGFLHPHCLSGGGGERVLWCAILAIRSIFPNAQIVVYSAWKEAGVALPDAVWKTKFVVREQFGLDLQDVSFLPVNITRASLVDPRNYPRLTLLLQALGAIRLGFHAFWLQPVDVFVDTANLTFSLVFPKVFGADTVSYVHYPTISTDMLTLVRSRKAQFNNSAAIASSARLSYLKLWYYRAFALLYAFAALFCDLPMANSSWTRKHLEAIWWRNRRLETVFPPCPTFRSRSELMQRERDNTQIVSVGQFRPEKNHALQLDIMEYLQRKHARLNAKLVMIGGTRNSADENRVRDLIDSARKRKLPVDVMRNATREELASALDGALVGLHTMKDEHFGISVVELQAHGLVVVAHGSGGVKTDIVKDGETGLLVGPGEVEAEMYGDRIVEGIGMAAAERSRMRMMAVVAAGRFSEEGFRTRFGEVFGRFLTGF